MKIWQYFRLKEITRYTLKNLASGGHLNGRVAESIIEQFHKDAAEYGIKPEKARRDLQKIIYKAMK